MEAPVKMHAWSGLTGHAKASPRPPNPGGSPPTSPKYLCLMRSPCGLSSAAADPIELAAVNPMSRLDFAAGGQAALADLGALF